MFEPKLRKRGKSFTSKWLKWLLSKLNAYTLETLKTAILTRTFSICGLALGLVQVFLAEAFSCPYIASFHKISSAMRFVILVLMALIAVSTAFMPSRAIRSKVSSKAMTMKVDLPKLNKFLPAAILPFAMPLASMAAEGTGRAFGIDDPRLIWAALAPSLILFPLYSKWSSEQEPDDFFDGYEKRRNG